MTLASPVRPVSLLGVIGPHGLPLSAYTGRECDLAWSISIARSWPVATIVRTKTNIDLRAVSLRVESAGALRSQSAERGRPVLWRRFRDFAIAGDRLSVQAADVLCNINRRPLTIDD